MPSHTRCCVAVFYLLSLTCAIKLSAQTSTSAPATQPASRPTSAPANPAADAEARKFVADTLARYRGLKSYSDKLEARVEVVASDKDGQDVGQDESYASQLAYAKPNRIAYTTDNFAVQCDGRKLWLFVAALSQYTEADAPARLDLEKVLEELMSDDPPHPVLHVLDRPDAQFAELFPMVREFTAVEKAEQEGRPGMRLAGLLDAARTPLGLEGETVPFTLWFDAETRLLAQLRIDFTAALRKMLLEPEPGGDGESEQFDPPGKPKKIDRAIVTINLRNVKADDALDDERFTYKPDKDVEKVKEFDWEQLYAMPDPEELVGEPAPLFAGTALDEKPFSLEELRGRVVLLDFWATWCRPCVQAIPKIQKLAEKFAEKPVAIIGVNQDAKGMDAKVKKFVADQKLTFRQFVDADGKLGRKYKVAAIPCTFLLDKKGTVQAVHVGGSPKLDEELTEQIEKLLKGADLYDPAKLAERRKAKQSDEATERRGGEGSE